MKSKRVILRRLTALYVIFFAVIAFGVVRSVSHLTGEDFNTGRQDAVRLANERTDGRHVGIIYELKVATSGVDFETPIYTGRGDSIEIYARPAFFDVETVTPYGKHLGGMTIPLQLGFILSTATYAAVFVILFVIIGSLRKSIRNDDLFKKSNIALTRAIGILLICASLMFSLITWLDAKSVAGYFAGSAYEINTAFPFNFSEIIMGVVIFIIAEIFAISSSLSEEQKLTI